MYISNKFLSAISIVFTVCINSIYCYNNQTYNEEEIINNEPERIKHVLRGENGLKKRDYSYDPSRYVVFKPLLQTYNVKVNNANVELIRMGKQNDGGYVIPVEAMRAADVMLGYGIDNDISFEREFSQRYDKASYGFDCGVRNIETGHDKCYFLSECIGTSYYLYGNQQSSGKIFTFDEQLDRLRLTNKKIVLKMDIEGAEYYVIDDLLKHQQQITGIVIEVHFTRASLESTYRLFSKLNEHFLLLHLHGNNCCQCKLNEIPPVLELTYINKNLVSSYELTNNHKYPLPIDQQNCKHFMDCSFEI